MHRSCTEYLIRKRTLVRIYVPTEDHIRSRRHCPPPGPLQYRQGRPLTAPHGPVPQPSIDAAAKTDGCDADRGPGVMVGVGAMARAGPPAELWPAGRETRPASCPLMGSRVPAPRIGAGRPAIQTGRGPPHLRHRQVGRAATVSLVPLEIVLHPGA